MAGIMDLLASLGLGSQPQTNSLGFGQTSNGVAPGQSTSPGGQTVTPLSQVVVTAAKGPNGVNPQMPSQASSAPMTMAAPPNMSGLDQSVPSLPSDSNGVLQGSQGAPFNYDNSSAAAAVNQAVQKEPFGGQGGNPGIYGLLPQNLQHGTLRNVLGAIGDAFLVGSNRQPQYAPAMARMQVGQAMAGMNPNDPDSMYAAASRVAATGVSGAAEMSDKIVQQAEQAAMRKQYMEYNQNYREQVIGNKADNTLRLQAPQVSGMVNSAKTAQDYATRYAQAEAIAQRIGPNYHASDFGLVSPDQWQPGMTQGLTANQEQLSSDKSAQRDVTKRGQDFGYQGRVTSATINAGGHVRAAQISAGKPTSGTIEQGIISKMNSEQPLSAGEQYYVQHSPTFNAKSGRQLLVPPAGGSGAQPAHQQFQNGMIYHDAHGNSARYQNGQWISVNH
jgi:hypothetical protein